MALGRLVPARRAIAASSAREGEKARNGSARIVVRLKSLEKLVLDVFLVVDHDYDLKNRCRAVHSCRPPRANSAIRDLRILFLRGATACENVDYVRAERAGATLRDLDKAPDTRGSHNAATLERYGPKQRSLAWPAGLTIGPI